MACTTTDPVHDAQTRPGRTGQERRTPQKPPTSWRLLGALIMLVSGAALVYGLLAAGCSGDPLAALFIPLVIAPAAPPFLLGMFIWRGHLWALIALRLCIVAIIAGGVFLNIAYELNVFGFAPFAVPFIGFCLFILTFSIVAQYRQ